MLSNTTPDSITKAECEEADGLVIIRWDAEKGGFTVKAEGNDLVSRLRMAMILSNYAAHILYGEASRS